VDRSQAEAVVALVQAYFPRPELPASTVMAWATELGPFDFDDAQEAARRLSRDYRYPVLAELIGLVDEVRQERLAVEDVRPVLPASEAEVMAAMPENIRVKVRAMVDPDRKRKEAEAEQAEGDAEWRRVKAASLARLRMHGTCLGTDKPPVEMDGRWVCPVCRIEIEDVRNADRRAFAADRRKAARA